VQLHPNSSNGLKKQSLIRVSKIATIDRGLAKGLLGKLDPTQIADLDLKLKALLQLP